MNVRRELNPELTLYTVLDVLDLTYVELHFILTARLKSSL